MTSTKSRATPIEWMVGLGFASILVPLNSTMIAVALPDISHDLDISTGTTGLLITVYLAVMLVGQPLAGRLSDALGGRRVVLGALVGFGVCSVAASFARNFPLLVGGRVAQAIFGAALMPVTRALIRQVTPAHQRGRNFGLQEALFGVGAATGPLVGGVVIEFTGWHGVFLVNVPVAACALVLLHGLPSDDRSSAAGSTSAPGSPMAMILAERSFAFPFVSQAAAVLAQYSLLLTVPVVLDGRGWSSTQVGSALILLTVGMVVSGPVGGRVGDHRGRRLPAVIGMTIGIAGISLAAAAIDNTPAAVLVGMAAFGLGFGLAVPNLTTAALESAPHHMAGSASGMWSMSRYVGSIPASLLFAALVSDGTDGAQTLLLVAAAAMVLAIASASRLASASEHS